MWVNEILYAMNHIKPPILQTFYILLTAISLFCLGTRAPTPATDAGEGTRVPVAAEI